MFNYDTGAETNIVKKSSLATLGNNSKAKWKTIYQ